MRNALYILVIACFILISSPNIFAQDIQTNPEQDQSEIKSESLKAEMYVYASWNGMSDEQKRSAIIDQSRNFIGSRGGQCKYFVQKVVVQPISGILLPSNYENFYDPFDRARWNYSSEVAVVYQWLGLLSSISQLKLKNGFIIQWRMNNSARTPHTMIVEAVGLYTIQVIDSNFSTNNDEIVRRHWIDLNWIRANVSAGTVYQVR